MSPTKLPLDRNNSVMTSLFPPRESLVVTSQLGTGNSRTFFYGVWCKQTGTATTVTHLQTETEIAADRNGDYGRLFADRDGHHWNALLCRETVPLNFSQRSDCLSWPRATLPLNPCQTLRCKRGLRTRFYLSILPKLWKL